MTYVAGVATTLIQILKLILMIGRRNDWGII
jgi:Zn-dependent membrane protease YugP